MIVFYHELFINSFFASLRIALIIKYFILNKTKLQYCIVYIRVKIRTIVFEGNKILKCCLKMIKKG